MAYLKSYDYCDSTDGPVIKRMWVQSMDDQTMPRGVERDDLIKGKKSDVRCRCGGDVLFTHCSEMTK